MDLLPKASLPLLKYNNLLSANEPPAVKVIAAGKQAPVILACEHAGRMVPQLLARGAPDSADMLRHIAYDIGAMQVATKLAFMLNVTLVMQRYSRLVIDCNRPRSAPDLCPVLADGTQVRFNECLNEAIIEHRWQSIHQPFHLTLADTLKHSPEAALVTIHSFTPCLNEFDRPWHIGFLARHDLRLADFLLDYFSQSWPQVVSVLNQPYKIESDTDYTIPVHGEQQGRPHVLIEIRNDLINNAGNAQVWTERLAAGLSQFVSRHSGN